MDQEEGYHVNVVFSTTKKTNNVGGERLFTILRYLQQDRRNATKMELENYVLLATTDAVLEEDRMHEKSFLDKKQSIQ